MIVTGRAGFFFVALYSVQAMLPAASKPLELEWSELAPIVASHRVELALSDGALTRL